LGGDDFDQRIIDYMVTEFKKEQGIDLSQDKMGITEAKRSSRKS